ncbi:MAG: hypothetical protein PHX43_03790 [Alphaproteobacteria bacterium]|nr:hypothetical protein [Alphaproteobacteria bacterium]
MELTKREKKELIEARMHNISRDLYNQELNLVMYRAYGERPEVIAQTEANREKQLLAYAALDELLVTVEALAE